MEVYRENVRLFWEAGCPCLKGNVAPDFLLRAVQAYLDFPQSDTFLAAEGEQRAVAGKDQVLPHPFVSRHIL